MKEFAVAACRWHTPLASGTARHFEGSLAAARGLTQQLAVLAVGLAGQHVMLRGP
jgi:hypothetical protein